MLLHSFTWPQPGQHEQTPLVARIMDVADLRRLRIFTEHKDLNNVAGMIGAALVLNCIKCCQFGPRTDR